MYKYHFISTVEDLLEAEEAERTARSARAPFRWAIVLLGVIWLVAGMVSFDWANPSWRPIIWLLLGLGIIYYFLIRPYIRRNRIKKRNEPQQDLILEFRDDCIRLDISGVGNFTRKWEELIDFIDAYNGIIFYFSDGVVNWLPNRVFTDEGERSNFIKFIQEHQNQEYLSSMAQTRGPQTKEEN